MVDLIHAARIAMHDDEFFPPETDVILTSTISDATLAQYTFEDELRIIRAIKPRWVLPFDFPVYGDMDPGRRETHLAQIAGGARDMQHILGPLPDDEIQRVCEVKDLPRELVEPVQNTTVIPLVKGTTPDERGIVYTAADDLSAPLIAKYGVQYMTVGGNGSYPALCEDLATINAETTGHPTLIIGLLSPSGRYSLEGVPENVVAAAGTNQWLKHVEPTSNSPSEMQEAFEAFYNAVADTLNVDVRYHSSIAAARLTNRQRNFKNHPVTQSVLTFHQASPVQPVTVTTGSGNGNARTTQLTLPQPGGKVVCSPPRPRRVMTDGRRVLHSNRARPERIRR